MPCVNLGKGPNGTRVGLPKLDSIRDHKRDVFVEDGVGDLPGKREKEMPDQKSKRALIIAEACLDHIYVSLQADGRRMV